MFAVLGRPLHSKHRLQNTEHLQQRVIGQNAQMPDQAISVDSPEPFSNHVTMLIMKSATYTKKEKDVHLL
jgi:hypothetical protein